MSKTVAEQEDPFERVREAAARQMSPEGSKAQRVPFILSAAGKDDSNTGKEVENYVDER